MYLEPPHVPGVSGVLQAVLVALQEEFEEVPEKRKRKKKDGLRLDRCANQLLTRISILYGKVVSAIKRQFFLPPPPPSPPSFLSSAAIQEGAIITSLLCSGCWLVGWFTTNAREGCKAISCKQMPIPSTVEPPHMHGEL